MLDRTSILKDENVGPSVSQSPPRCFFFSGDDMIRYFCICLVDTRLVILVIFLFYTHLVRSLHVRMLPKYKIYIILNNMHYIMNSSTLAPFLLINLCTISNELKSFCSCRNHIQLNQYAPLRTRNQLQSTLHQHLLYALPVSVLNMILLKQGPTASFKLLSI